MKQLVFAPAAAILALLCCPAPTPAQEAYSSGASDARQHGYEHGYREGFAFGQNSQVSNRDQDIVNQKLRAADKDYQPSFGSRDLYKQGYTDGFRAGMQDSRSGNRSRLDELFRSRDPNYDPDTNRDARIQGIDPQNRWPAKHLANDVAYRDGFDAGARDRQRNRTADPRQHGAWKDASHGYDPRNGSKGKYRSAYRSAYELGYADGFGRPR